MGEHEEIGDSVFLFHISLTGRDGISTPGSGGKTTFMYLLARKLFHKGKRVLTTTTIKIHNELNEALILTGFGKEHRLGV